MLVFCQGSLIVWESGFAVTANLSKQLLMIFMFVLTRLNKI